MMELSILTEFINVSCELNNGQLSVVYQEPITNSSTSTASTFIRYSVFLEATRVQVYSGRSKYLNYPELFRISVMAATDKPKQLIAAVKLNVEKMYEIISSGRPIPYRREIIQALLSMCATRNLDRTKSQTLSLKQFLKSQYYCDNSSGDESNHCTLTESQVAAKRWVQAMTDQIVASSSSSSFKFVSRYHYVELIKDKLFFDAVDRCFVPARLENQSDAVMEVKLRGACFFADHCFGKTRIMAGIRSNTGKPTLVICPSHTCEHWVKEIKIMRPTATIQVIGNKRQYDRVSATSPLVDYYIVASQFIENYHYQRDIHDLIYGRSESVANRSNSSYTIYNDYFNSDYCLYRLIKREVGFYARSIDFFAFHAIEWGLVVVDEAQNTQSAIVDFVRLIDCAAVWCLSAKPFANQDCYERYVSMLAKDFTAIRRYIYKPDFINLFLTKFCSYYSFAEENRALILRNVVQVDYDENELAVHNSIIERYDCFVYSISEICTYPYFYFERLINEESRCGVYRDLETLEKAIMQQQTPPNPRYLENTLVSLKQNFTMHECLICKQNLRYDMTILICGHFFCITCYESWYQRHRQCPICRHAIDHSSKFYLLLNQEQSGGYGSKLIKVMEDCKQKVVFEGQRVLVYSRSDRVIAKLHRLLLQNKVPAARFFGNTSVKMKSLRYFAEHPSSCLLLSGSVAIDGLDLSMLSVVIFIDGNSAFRNANEKTIEENQFFAKMGHNKTIASYRYLVNAISDQEFYYE